MTAVAYIWGLGQSGWANSFYSAAVQAGTESGKAFFFGSIDASNFITVDKPPASLWVMELSTRIFGLNSWSMLVPEAIMGVASVWILYMTIRRWFSEDHFDKSIELEIMLEEKQKMDLLKEVQQISSMANIHYIRQKEPLGLGHAVLCAEQFIGDEPFAILLGDDIMVSEPPVLKQLIDIYYRTKESVNGVRKVPAEDVSKYGIIDPRSKFGQVHSVNDLVEKPTIHNAPSDMAVMGRYILNPSIFSYLKTIEFGVGNELQLTDALRLLSQKERLFALELLGKRYDIGDKTGYIKAMIEVALQREDLKNTTCFPILKKL
ncbi:sugar phosphate nucleotidyltransferase [Neobacillus pocheonensis]|uniref:sugar phosphate nucleotidyltransferase n=1 Tax=Neobacillus pocheonensis TaxID=363869 RepID=UPI003D26831A